MCPQADDNGCRFVSNPAPSSEAFDWNAVQWRATRPVRLRLLPASVGLLTVVKN